VLLTDTLCLYEKKKPTDSSSHLRDDIKMVLQDIRWNFTDWYPQEAAVKAVLKMQIERKLRNILLSKRLLVFGKGYAK